MTAIKTKAMFGFVLLSLVIANDAFALKIFGKKKFDVVIQHPYIDVRSGPGRGYPIFHAVEKGDVITLKKRRTDWYKIETKKGVIGWVSRDKLNGSLTVDGELLSFDKPGWDEYINRKWEIGVLMGEFGGEDSYSVFAGYRWTPNISTELKYSDIFSNEGNATLYSLNIVHQPFTEWKLSPFFTLGTGELNVSPNTVLIQTTNDTANVMTVGGGFVYYLSRRLLLRAEYNDHTVLESTDNNEEVYEWKAGFSVFF